MVPERVHAGGPGGLDASPLDRWPPDVPVEVRPVDRVALPAEDQQLVTAVAVRPRRAECSPTKRAETGGSSTGRPGTEPQATKLFSRFTSVRTGRVRYYDI